MDSILKSVKPVIDWLVENKWSLVFIIFGILVAFSIGQQLAEGKREHFDDEPASPPEEEKDRCDKQKDMYADNKPCEDCDTKPKKKVKRVKVASASCPEAPDMSQYVLKKDVPDLSEYVHKSLVPNMSNYMSKSEVDSNYMLKSACKMNEPTKEDKEISSDDESVEEEELEITVNNQCGSCGQPQNRCYCHTPYREVQVPTCNSKPSEKQPTKKEMKKREEELIKNKDNMDVTYTPLEQAFTGCNLAICGVNGKPNGLGVKKTSS